MSLTATSQWNNWDSPPNVEGNSTQVLWESGDTTFADPVTLTLTVSVRTLGFEMEQNNAGLADTQPLHVDFYSGATLIGSINRTVTVPGAPLGSAANGALLFAATSTDSSQPITSVVITSSTNVNDVAIAQLRYALPDADLAVTKTDSPDPVNAGSDLTYAVNLTNNGPSDAQSVSLSDTLPTGTTFVSSTAPAGWATSSPAVGGTGTVTFSRPTLALGDSGTFTIVVHVTSGVPDGTILSNTATGRSATSDPDRGNNSATANTRVITSADLGITKTTTTAGPSTPGTSSPTPSPSRTTGRATPPRSTSPTRSHREPPLSPPSRPPDGPPTSQGTPIPGS